MNDHIAPNQIAKAKEWAEVRQQGKGTPLHLGDAAAEVIANLPDTIVDADRVRGQVNLLISEAADMASEGLSQRYVAIAHRLQAILTPPLPTLDDLIEEGHDPAQYQFTQAEHRDERCIIIRVPGYPSKPVISLLTATGATIWTSPDEVIPLPDLPRLVWPASEPEPAEETPDEPERTYAPGGVVTQEALDKLNTPEPQVGEAWKVVYAVANSESFNVIYGDNGNAFDFQGSKWKQTELIPIARLVPEVVPKVLTTEEDYRNVPNGTICAEDGDFPLHTSVGAWYTIGGDSHNHSDLAGTPRRVLRWGLGEQA